MPDQPGIPAVPTSITAFVGRTRRGPVDRPVAVGSYAEFESVYGGPWDGSALPASVRDFFDNGGTSAVVARLYRSDGGASRDGLAMGTLDVAAPGASDGQPLDDDAFVASGLQAAERGLYLLEQADDVNLLVIPPYSADGGVGTEVLAAAAEYCEERRAVLLVDPPPAWRSVADVVAAAEEGFERTLGVAGRNAAAFFPRIRRTDPSPGEGAGAPSGAVAGVIARTDMLRGVWTAPAGAEATLDGVQSLTLALPDGDIARLASVGVNALRTLPGAGPVVWGARTLQGADGSASEWTYLPVRRLALFIEESLDLGTRWAGFEPNDAALWARIRLDAVALLDDLFRRGAFQGATPQQAYVVRCDSATTTQADVDLGVVNVVVGFAPLKPAEFVMIRLQQRAGQPRNGGSGRRSGRHSCFVGWWPW